jgi:FG-GAP repeat protein
VNNDNFDDIITGAEANAHVKVFSGVDNSEIRSFFAFPGFTGGVRVAAGDVNGDGHADIIAGAGASGAGHVKVFDGLSLNVLQDFFAYGSSYAGGVFVAASDVIPEPSAVALFAWVAPIGVFAYRGRAATRGC